MGSRSDASGNSHGSYDGRFVVFATPSQNLTDDDLSGSGAYHYEVFGYDRQYQSTIWLSRNTGGEQSLYTNVYPSISDNGRFVAYYAQSDDQAPSDTNEKGDIVLLDRDVDNDGVLDEVGQTARLVVSRTETGAQISDADSGPQSCVAGDGFAVAFNTPSDQPSELDENEEADVYVRSLCHPDRACVADIDGDGMIDLDDLSAVLAASGATCGDAEYDAAADLNCDCAVDLTDLSAVLANYGNPCP